MIIKQICLWVLYKIRIIQYYILKFFDKCIIIESFAYDKIIFFLKCNWGDDLNKFFIEYITDKKVMSIPVSKLGIKYDNVYSLIGSTLSYYSMDNKIIYGTGLRNPYDKLNGIPKRIISVRGPKTRKVLLDKGYVCPEQYGDPALLLPLFYTPNIQSEEYGCLILNNGTDKRSVSNIISKMVESMKLKVVCMTKYDKWTDIIDEIANSQYVISESLHGLIVAETYGVPNVWVEFKNHPDYWDFKFEDYYESIGKAESIIKLQDKVDLGLIKEKISMWHKGSINYREMISCFPFEIKCRINQLRLYDINDGK